MPTELHASRYLALSDMRPMSLSCYNALALALTAPKSGSFDPRTHVTDDRRVTIFRACELFSLRCAAQLALLRLPPS